MIEPRLVIDDFTGGYHNLFPEKTEGRLKASQMYRDLSTICIIPCGAQIPSRVVQNWWGLMTPMNQKFLRIFSIGLEVGVAYSKTIEQILAHPELSKFKYILTLEHDNMPPVDGLIKLYENIEGFAAMSGIYWTKGEGGQPMCYGKPEDGINSFIPFLPPNSELEKNPIVECNGIGMGFALWDMDLFRDERITKPWFETKQDATGQGTQDLVFCKKARELGYKFGVDTRVKVGHYDLAGDMVW